MRQRKTGVTTLVRTTLALLAAGTAMAEPVHIEFQGRAGAGYSFSRAGECFVLTAAHVVEDNTGTGRASVVDRSGARASASVTVHKAEDDVALLTVDSGKISCSSSWPADDAALPARMNSQTQFEVVRHYPNGRESVVLLRYAGGTPGELQLQHVDSTRIIPSDSGSLAFFGDHPVGIVKQVDPESGVYVVPMKVVREIVGWKFGAASGAKTVAFAGTEWQGRPHQQWTTFAAAWLRDKAGRTLVEGPDAPRACGVQFKVVNWQQANEANPKYQSAQSTVASSCNKKGFIWELACSGARNTLKDTPSTVRVHRVMMEVTVAPPGSPASARLETVRVVSPPEVPHGAEMENQVLRATLDALASPVLQATGC